MEVCIVEKIQMQHCPNFSYIKSIIINLKINEIQLVCGKNQKNTAIVTKTHTCFYNLFIIALQLVSFF